MSTDMISSNPKNFRYSKCIYNRHIKLWEKIKGLRENNRSVSKAEKVERHSLGTIRMMFLFHLTNLIRALVRIRPQQKLIFHFSLLLYFKSWPGIIQVVNKIRAFAKGEF